MYKMELHIHTRYSKDSLLCLNLLYIKCILKRIRCVAITEHNNIAGALAFEKLCKKRRNKIFVIIGEEIFTKTGEVIGLYLKKEISSQMSCEDTMNEIIRQGGIVYIPHPYDEHRNKTVLNINDIKSNIDKIDCIECYNGRNISGKYEEKQRSIADEFAIAKVIGSDAHTILEVGRNIIYVNKIPKNSQEFKTCINNCTFVKKERIMFAHYITKFAKIIKLALRGDFYEIKRIIIKRIRKRM